MSDGIPRSPLDKPLHLLTEDDISQLTREDCRRYLIQKGMRRPSWNKSQAIQQVISLKALLEPPLPDRVDVPSVATEKRGDVAAPVSLKLSPRKEYTVPGADLAAGSPRDANLQAKQLTIFYSGKVNVYDDVSRDKARTLLQLATSPLSCLMDTQYEETPIPQPHVVLPQNLATKAGSNYFTANLQPSQTGKALDNCQLQKEESSISREDNQEGASSRKACVQRYLEKRKDRFKRKVGMISADAYLYQRMVDTVRDEQLGPSDIYSSSPQSSLPHFPSKCSRAGNTIGDLNLSVINTDADEL